MISYNMNSMNFCYRDIQTLKVSMFDIQIDM